MYGSILGRLKISFLSKSKIEEGELALKKVFNYAYKKNNVKLYNQIMNGMVHHSQNLENYPSLVGSISYKPDDFSEEGIDYKDALDAQDEAIKFCIESCKIPSYIFEPVKMVKNKEWYDSQKFLKSMKHTCDVLTKAFDPKGMMFKRRRNVNTDVWRNTAYIIMDGLLLIQKDEPCFARPQAEKTLVRLQLIKDKLFNNKYIDIINLRASAKVQREVAQGFEETLKRCKQGLVQNRANRDKIERQIDDKNKQITQSQNKIKKKTVERHNIVKGKLSLDEKQSRLKNIDGSIASLQAKIDNSTYTITKFQERIEELDKEYLELQDKTKAERKRIADDIKNYHQKADFILQEVKKREEDGKTHGKVAKQEYKALYLEFLAVLMKGWESESGEWVTSGLSLQPQKNCLKTPPTLKFG